MSFGETFSKIGFLSFDISLLKHSIPIHSIFFRSKESHSPKTQFVVTLDTLGFPQKKQLLSKENVREVKRGKIENLKMDERKKLPISSRIGRRSAETENESELRKAVEDSHRKSSGGLKRKRTPIKFDIKDRGTESAGSEPVKKRRSRSGDRKSADRDHRKSAEKDESRRRDDRSNERDRDANESSSKIRTKTISQNKYDNLPPRKKMSL